jgi:hypothetical protein
MQIVFWNDTRNCRKNVAESYGIFYAICDNNKSCWNRFGQGSSCVSPAAQQEQERVRSAVTISLISVDNNKIKWTIWWFKRRRNCLIIMCVTSYVDTWRDNRGGVINMTRCLLNNAHVCLDHLPCPPTWVKIGPMGLVRWLKPSRHGWTSVGPWVAY